MTATAERQIRMMAVHADRMRNRIIYFCLATEPGAGGDPVDTLYINGPGIRCRSRVSNLSVLGSGPQFFMFYVTTQNLLLPMMQFRFKRRPHEVIARIRNRDNGVELHTMMVAASDFRKLFFGPEFKPSPKSCNVPDEALEELFTVAIGYLDVSDDLQANRQAIELLRQAYGKFKQSCRQGSGKIGRPVPWWAVTQLRLMMDLIEQQSQTRGIDGDFGRLAINRIVGAFDILLWQAGMPLPVAEVVSRA